MSKEIVRFLEFELSQRYNSVIHDHEHGKDQCRGGYNFGMTLRQTWKSTRGNMESVAAVANVLYDIAEWPAAGSIAWEMRRFIRRATPEQTVEFAELMLHRVRRSEEQLREGPAFLDFDFLYFDSSWGGNDGSAVCQQELGYMKEAWGGRVVDGTVVAIFPS